MVVGQGLNADEVLQLVSFVVLLYLFDLSCVLELARLQLFLEEVLKRKAEGDIEGGWIRCELRLSLSLFGLLEGHAFLLEVAQQFLGDELSSGLVLKSLLDEITEDDLILVLRQLQWLFFDGRSHLIALDVDIAELLIDPALLLLQHALRLLHTLYIRRLLLLQKHRRLDKLLALVREIPNKDALRACGPQSIIVEEHIVDVLGVADVDLVRLSHEGVVPHLHEGVITHAEHEVAVVVEVYGVELVAVQRLHLDLDCHFLEIVAADRGVLEDRPEFLLIVLELSNDFAGEDLAHQLEAPQFPQVDVGAAVADNGN